MASSTESDVVQELSSRMQRAYERKVVDFDLVFKAQTAWFIEVLEKSQIAINGSSSRTPFCLPPTPSTNNKIRHTRSKISTTERNQPGFFQNTFVRDGSVHTTPSGGKYGTLPMRRGKSPYKRPPKRKVNTMRDVSKPLNADVASFVLGGIGKKPATSTTSRGDSKHSQLAKSSKTRRPNAAGDRRTSSRLKDKKKRKGLASSSRPAPSSSQKSAKHARNTSPSHASLPTDAHVDGGDGNAANIVYQPSLDDDGEWKDVYRSRDILRRIKDHSKHSRSRWTERRSAARREAVYSTSTPFFTLKKCSKIIPRLPSMAIDDAPIDVDDDGDDGHTEVGDVTMENDEEVASVGMEHDDDDDGGGVDDGELMMDVADGTSATHSSGPTTPATSKPSISSPSSFHPIRFSIDHLEREDGGSSKEELESREGSLDHAIKHNLETGVPAQTHPIVTSPSSSDGEPTLMDVIPEAPIAPHPGSENVPPSKSSRRKGRNTLESQVKVGALRLRIRRSLQNSRVTTSGGNSGSSESIPTSKGLTLAGQPPPFNNRGTRNTPATTATDTATTSRSSVTAREEEPSVLSSSSHAAGGTSDVMDGSGPTLSAGSDLDDLFSQIDDGIGRMKEGSGRHSRASSSGKAASSSPTVASEEPSPIGKIGSVGSIDLIGPYETPLSPISPPRLDSIGIDLEPIIFPDPDEDEQLTDCDEEEHHGGDDDDGILSASTSSSSSSVTSTVFSSSPRSSYSSSGTHAKKTGIKAGPMRILNSSEPIKKPKGSNRFTRRGRLRGDTKPSHKPPIKKTQSVQDKINKNRMAREKRSAKEKEEKAKREKERRRKIQNRSNPKPPKRVHPKTGGNDGMPPPHPRPGQRPANDNPFKGIFGPKEGQENTSGNTGNHLTPPRVGELVPVIFTPSPDRDPIPPYELSPYKDSAESDYSDSECDDEDVLPKRPIPDWASGQNLINRLRKQKSVDPEIIFGSVANQNCDLDAIFGGGPSSRKLKESRAKRRRGSAWGMQDKLSKQEKQMFKRHMGYIRPQYQRVE